MRIESPKRLKNGGWLHATGQSVAIGRREYEPPVLQESVDCESLAKEYQKQLTTLLMNELAGKLEVSEMSLYMLRVGWDGQAWTFPMQDETGKIVGIRRRLRDGKKLSVKGGHEGCFVPIGVPGDQSELIVVCEGASDTAAMTDLGFDAIGRPSCTGGKQIVKALTRKRNVAIVADCDGPGVKGAEDLANELFCRGRWVRIVQPLHGKDVREWKKTANHQIVGCVIRNSSIWSPR